MAESQISNAEAVQELLHDLRDVAREYKRLSGMYRRKAREVMDKLARLRQYYAAMGIHFEYEWPGRRFDDNE